MAAILRCLLDKNHEEMSPAEIRAVALAAGQDLDGDAVGRLAAFGRLFLTWNAHINLGSARASAELLDRHFRDAFAACRFIAESDAVVDVGAGGGLPIIPVALVRRGATYDLYEPVGKKVAFLRTAVREMGLSDSVRVHPSRLDLPVPIGVAGRFDVASSRATFPPGRWLTLGQELVRPGGRVLVFGTTGLPPGCPAPSEDFKYASDRHLFAFARQQRIP